MPKFNVIEKYYYEIEADTLEQAQERFQEFMESGDSDGCELEFSAKFIDNQTDYYDDNWEEVK